MAKKPPKFEALVINAIRQLQAVQGSTETEIANYLSQEYNVTGPELRKQVQLTLRRGMNYGILHKAKRGYVTCDRNIPDVLDVVERSQRRHSRKRGRGGKRKSARRGRSRSKKRRRGSRRRAATAGVRSRVRRVRRPTRRPVPRIGKERPKVKPSNEETSTNRQPTSNSRTGPKTPVRGRDPNNNQV